VSEYQSRKYLYFSFILAVNCTTYSNYQFNV